MPLDTKRVAGRLAYLDKHDPQRKLFGANGHQYQLRPRASEADVAAFERRHAIHLPEDYRQFLLELGNGGAGPCYGILGLDEVMETKEIGSGDLSKPFPYSQACNVGPELVQAIHDACESSDDDRVEQLYRRYDLEMTHDGAISICDYGCNLRFLLVVNGPEYGHLWFDATADLVGYSPVDPELPAEKASYCRAGAASDSDRRRVTFAQWYTDWLDASCRRVDGTEKA